MFKGESLSSFSRPVLESDLGILFMLVSPVWYSCTSTADKILKNVLYFFTLLS